MNLTGNLARVRSAAIAGLAVVLPLFGSCASQKVVEEYEGEILALREERTALKKRNRDLGQQVESYEIALNQANGEVAAANARAEEAAAAYDAELDAAGIDVSRRGTDVVFSMKSEVLFPSGSAKLSDNGQSTLRTLASKLQSDFADGYYWIEGHTDSDPIKKSGWDSNRDLSLARAMAVLHYLVEDAGISDEDCVVVGHGQYAPLVENNSANNKAMNRRVELVVRQ